MRTTIDIPERLHHRLLAVAHDRHQTLSQTVVEAVIRWLEPAPSLSTIGVSPLTGLPVINTGHTITTEDVRALEDEDVEYYHSFTTKPAE